ncbi:MAG: DNA polymerase II [Geobacteraceae bacterium GWC2_48_7]|nr:MAG: DNA polymerase II [Geobacteraceae bacterium GWC2_48_7]
MLNHETEHIPILFGHDQRTGIVAVEPAGKFVRLFIRTAEGLHFHDEPFRPFILVADTSLISGCTVPCSVRQLEGDDFFRYQLHFDSWNDCLAARDFLTAKSTGASKSTYSPFLFIPDLAHQYLTSTGTTLFKGMDFGELHTFTIDIETFCCKGFHFSNPERAEDRIISIACKDSHGEETVLRGDLLEERELLLGLNDVIRKSDPDVIIGHNIFRFDLDYIGKRASRLGVRLTWGRNGSTPHINNASRWNLAERVIDFPRWDIHGRHIIDTYFLVQHYDLAQRSLSSHSLKKVAIHFGVAAPDRVYLDGNDIADQFGRDPELLYRYNLDDVRETESIFRILGYPWFLQTRIFPYSFQSCPLRGNATKINSLFLREYLHCGHTIPDRYREKPEPFEGGYTELVRTGICEPVVHCDVASLYPSLMLAYRLKPASDSLGLFLPMLAELRNFRLKAKQSARESIEPAEKHYYGTLQQVFKVLINSFYGYLGTVLHNFSDPATAAEVTRLGRVTIKTMIELLRREGGEPIEVDTDGIYFIPPAGCETREEHQALIERISSQLHAGIEVEVDGAYRSMFAYKVKNYALLDYDGKITVKGSSLRSRGVETYLREFMRETIELFLNSGGCGVDDLYNRYVKKLVSRNFEITWIARTETLNESVAAYKVKLESGKRNRGAAFEIALAAGTAFRAGDQVSYYICGSGKEAVAYEQCRPVTAFDPLRPDINTAYYIDRLRQLKNRFEQFLPREPTLFDF